MNYPEKCRSFFGKLLGHSFARRQFGDKGYCCERCGLVVEVDVSEDLIIEKAKIEANVRIEEAKAMGGPQVVIYNFQPNGLQGLHSFRNGHGVPSRGSSLRWLKGGDTEAWRVSSTEIQASATDWNIGRPVEDGC